MKASTVAVLLSLAATLVAPAGPAAAQAAKPGARVAAAPTSNVLDATVTKVIDGDTLIVQAADRAPIDVRLKDIDAPEICQAHGAEAKKALEELALGKSGTLTTAGRDSYGRTIGTLVIDEQNIGKRMVEEGHAWSARFRFDRGPMVAQERMAKALGRGLHRAGGAVMPVDFRKTQPSCNGPAAAAATAAAAPAAADAGARAAPMPARATPTVAAAQASTQRVADIERAAVAGRAAPSPEFRCDGRKRCKQMTSCDEAYWFLASCPGVELDGDRDGIPCEDVLCRGRK